MFLIKNVKLVLQFFLVSIWSQIFEKLMQFGLLLKFLETGR